MQWQQKTFDQLTTLELYQILRLRSEVFVVEQKCIYQDIDNKDFSAIHLFLTENYEIVAYCRRGFLRRKRQLVGLLLRLLIVVNIYPA